MQGCQLSLPLFNTLLEVSGNVIRQVEAIWCIRIGKAEIEWPIFADGLISIRPAKPKRLKDKT